MKRKLAFVLMIGIVSTCPALFAVPAEIAYVRGKVEVCRNDSWVQLKVGDTVLASETISTGFQSEAKIKYKDSVMALGALTRITLDELSETQEKNSVSIYLNTGAVRSKVSHSDNKRLSYTVKSPVAVASVRGTDFLITSAGAVSCSEGAVAVYPNTEGRRSASNKSPEFREPDKEDGSDVSGDESAPENGRLPPATANTPAVEIFDAAPAGAVVVGENQQVTINVNGIPDRPMETASKQRERHINAGASLAERESVPIGGGPGGGQGGFQNVPEPPMPGTSDFAQTEINVKVTLSE